MGDLSFGYRCAAHCIVILLPFFCALVGGAVPHQAFAEELSCDLSAQIARFLSVRAAGDSGTGVEQREHIAEELERCARQDSTSPLREKALLDATILWQDIHRLNGSKAAAMKVLFLAKELERHYPATPTDAEAKLLQARVQWRMGDAKTAQELAEHVKRSFPRTAFARQAILLVSEFANPYHAETQEHRGVDGRPLVMLDPGHGGEDHGAVGPGGIIEKAVVLSIANRVAELLRENNTADVRLTRTRDALVPLAERTRMANEEGAALFVSFHTNASGDHGPRGLSTYYLDNSDDAASRSLAERENASLQVGGESHLSDLSVMLSSLIQSGKMDDSVLLAHSLHGEVMKEVMGSRQWGRAGVKDLGVKKAPFFVLVGAHMPCVLMELFFIDNKQDAALLAQEAFQDTIARGVVAGIEGYLRRVRGS